MRDMAGFDWKGSLGSIRLISLLVPQLFQVLCTHKHWDHAGACPGAPNGDVLGVPAPVDALMSSGGNEELAARASQTQSYTATGPHSAEREG